MTSKQGLSGWMILEALRHANRACNCGLGVSECECCCSARLADAVDALDVLSPTDEKCGSRLQFLSHLALSGANAVHRPE